MRGTVKTAMTVFALVSVLAFSAVAMGSEITAYTVWPPQNFQAQGLAMLAEKASANSGGELKINLEVGGSLGYKGPELLRAVKDGSLQIAEMVSTGVAGDEPQFGVRSLPFIIDTWEQAKLFDKVTRPFYDAAAAKWNQKVLYIAPWPFAGLWANKEVKSISDMVGMKTRTYDRNGALVVSAAGGNALSIPFSEVYSSLATGLIDSVITSATTVTDGKFWEVLKYYQPIRITITTSMVTINKDAYDALPEKERLALDKASAEVEEKMWDLVVKSETKNEEVCQEKGVVFVPVSPEFKKQLKEVSAGVITEWLENHKTAKPIYETYVEARDKASN